MYELLNVDADKASEEKLRALVKHLQGQMRDVYVYWVGNWGRGNQACSTRNGQFVSKKRLLIISTANQVSLDRNFCLLLVKSPSSSDPVKPGSVSLMVPKVGIDRTNVL